MARRLRDHDISLHSPRYACSYLSGVLWRGWAVSMAECSTSDRLDGISACHLSTVHSAVDTRILYKEARSLANAGCEVTVVARLNGTRGYLEGVHVLGLPTKKSRLQRFSLLPRALQLALQTRSDIYHLHDPELLLIAPALWLLARRPIVYDVHEYYPEAIPAKEYIPRLLRRPAAFAYVVLERLVTPVLAGFIQPTPAQMALCSWTQKPKALVANYAWADHYPEPDWSRPRPHVAVHTGSLTRSRAIGEMIRAMPQVVERFPDARLVLLGQPQSESYEQELMALAKRSRVRKTVQFAGWVPFPQVRDTLYSASVGLSLLLPVADMKRCYPTKLFEYMAAGLPIVSDSLPHCRAIVEDAKCGLVVDAANPAAVAKAISYLFEHPEEAVEMGRRGRRAFLEKYAWEGEARKLVALYKRLLGDRRLTLPG